MSETKPPTPSAPDLKFTAEQRRIQSAIWRISEHLPTQFRAYLDGYLRFVSPTMYGHSDVNFPTAVRRHPRNPERTTMGEKENILYFLAGNAILAYYSAIKSKGTGVLPEFLERQVVTLEEVARVGYNQCCIEGNDTDGYTLIPKDQAKVAFVPPGGINDEKRTERM